MSGIEGQSGLVLLSLSFRILTRLGHQRQFRDRDVMERAEPAPSLCLCSRKPDNLPPFLCFLGKALSIFGRREGKHQATKVCKACLDLRISKDRVDLPVELVDDSAGR